MLAVIKGIDTDMKVISLILESSKDFPGVFKLFHCIHCGYKMFQYSGDIVMLLPGGTKTLSPVVIMCHSCKQRYLINSIL